MISMSPYHRLEDGQFQNEDGEIDYHEISLALKLSEKQKLEILFMKWN